MTLFLHSYSFLKFDTSFTYFSPDSGDMKKFEKFLVAVTSDPEFQVITMKQFYNLYTSNPALFDESSDVVPVMERQISLANACRTGLRYIRTRTWSRVWWGLSGIEAGLSKCAIFVYSLNNNGQWNIAIREI